MSSARFPALLFESVLDHEESFRGSVSHLAREAGYVLAANPEIPGPEANAFLRIRTDRKEAEALLRRALKHDLGVVVDARTRPPDLPARLKEAGFKSSGRRFVAFLDPDSLEVLPPGIQPEFTAVGPAQLETLLKLMDAQKGESSRLVWSLRLRNLLFSAYLAKNAAGLVVFHCAGLARLIGPFPTEHVSDFAFFCTLVSHAWKRAVQKKCEKLYSLVPAELIDSFKPVGFRVHEGWWVEEFSLDSSVY